MMWLRLWCDMIWYEVIKIMIMIKIMMWYDVIGCD